MTREIRLAALNSTRITLNDTIVALEFLKSGYPVSYVCNLSTGEITHHANYFYSTIPKTILPAGNLLVNQVSACDFTIAPQGKIVKLIITLTDNDTSITLFQQVAIRQ